jgi:hypothetical protein
MYYSLQLEEPNQGGREKMKKLFLLLVVLSVTSFSFPLSAAAEQWKETEIVLLTDGSVEGVSGEENLRISTDKGDMCIPLSEVNQVDDLREFDKLEWQEFRQRVSEQLFAGRRFALETYARQKSPESVLRFVDLDSPFTFTIFVSHGDKVTKCVK